MRATFGAIWPSGPAGAWKAPNLDRKKTSDAETRLPARRPVSPARRAHPMELQRVPF